MAVYWVSLPQLPDGVAERAERCEGISAPPPTQEARANPVAPAGGDDPSAEASVAATHDLADVTQRLLELPKPRIEQLLSELGNSEGKALLVLIHRLAAVESQLADLQARMSVTATPAPVAAGGRTVHTEPRAAGKSELLDQVYRKNLLLRRMDESGPQC